MRALGLVLIVMIIVTFGLAATFNLLWVIKSRRHHPQYTWIKIFNTIVCSAWVVSQIFSLVVQIVAPQTFDYSWFSTTILRSINAFTGVSMAAGSIARLKAYERVADEDRKWIIL